jgi:hypothetical protein
MMMLVFKNKTAVIRILSSTIAKIEAMQHFLCNMQYVISLESGERKVRSWALPCLVSPFLTGNPSIRVASPLGEGEPQVKHLFKTAGSGERGKAVLHNWRKVL